MHVEKLKRPAFLCTWKFKYCFEHTFILIISCIVYRIAHGEAVVSTNSASPAGFQLMFLHNG